MSPPVVIVGAGPAGSSLAIRLARAGHDVQLLDAAEFPRPKPCGDAISPGALPLLEELGVVDDLEAAGARRLEGWSFCTEGGIRFEGRFGGAPAAGPPWSYGISRAELDAILVRRAREAGARLVERTRVFALERDAGRVRGVVARDAAGRERHFPAALVVGADGLRSVVARRLGKVARGARPKLALVARLGGLPEGPGRGEFRLSAEGCVGRVPIGRGRYNVTVVVPASRAREISGNPGGFFRGRLEGYGLGEWSEGAAPEGELAVTGPFRHAPRRTSAPGCLLVGDASGYFDPFTGQGVYRALATARAAAEAVRGVLAEPRREARHRRAYERELRGIVEPGRRLQRAIDSVLRHPGITDLVGRWLGRRPDLVERLLDVTGDRRPARDLLRLRLA